MLELARTRYDVAIVGAGPVGLALAIELARLDLATLVVDRRPAPDDDPGLRPQLLVARAGDLAHLEHLGVDIGDSRLVSLFTTRTEGDLTSGRFERRPVLGIEFSEVFRPRDLMSLAAQRPLALVPIGRLQQALLDEARRVGVEIAYECEVTRLRRHVTEVSFSCGDAHATATLVVIATGAARPLIESTGCKVIDGKPHRMIGGVFDAARSNGHWSRLEVPLDDYQVVRATVLETTEAMGAGTAVIVDAPHPELGECGFHAAANAAGLYGARLLATPTVFSTSVASISGHFVGGDGRAPVAIAGDAAQTGHVFTGQTCFLNLALALGLAEELRSARAAIVDGRISDRALLTALGKYDRRSRLGAAILAERSVRHTTTHEVGDWALAGVA